jgi:hypothetical protein
MALNIKARETKTEAIRRALEERKSRLALRVGRRTKSLEKMADFLQREIWSKIPPDVLGKPISKQERKGILGLGPDGYPQP